MSSIIKKYNKQNGVTYVYESVSYWDKEKQQPRSKRKLIGKIDEATGEIVPTAGRGRKPKADNPSNSKEITSPVPAIENLCVDTETVYTDADYKVLYEQSRKQLLEKDALIASQTGTIDKLQQERNQLRAKVEEMMRLLRH